MNRAKEFGKNTLIMFIGNFGARFISLFLLPFYTHWLSTDQYGIVDLITVYQSLLVNVVTFGLVEAIFVFPKNVSLQQQKEYFSTAINFSILILIITSVFFVIAKDIFLSFGLHNVFAEYTWWIFLMLISSYVQSLFQQFCRSIDKLSLFSFLGIILSILVGGLSVALIPRFGIIGYLLSIILSNLLTALVTFYFGKFYQYYSFHNLRKERLKEMVSFSLPLVPNGIMWWLIGTLNRPLLESYIGISSIGLFAVAQKIPNMAAIFYKIVGTAWQTSVFDEYNSPNFISFYNRILCSMTAFVSCIIIILSTFASVIINILVSAEFIDSSQYVPLLCVPILFLCLESLVSPIFSFNRSSKYFFYSTIYSTIVSIILNFILIPRYGVFGAVISMCISYFILTLIRVIFSYQYVPLYNCTLYILLSLVVTIHAVLCTLFSNIFMKCFFLCFSLLFVVLIYRKFTEKVNIKEVLFYIINVVSNFSSKFCK